MLALPSDAGSSLARVEPSESADLQVSAVGLRPHHNCRLLQLCNVVSADPRFGST